MFCLLNDYIHSVRLSLSKQYLHGMSERKGKIAQAATDERGEGIRGGRENPLFHHVLPSALPSAWLKQHSPLSAKRPRVVLPFLLVFFLVVFDVVRLVTLLFMHFSKIKIIFITLYSQRRILLLLRNKCILDA